MFKIQGMAGQGKGLDGERIRGEESYSLEYPCDTQSNIRYWTGQVVDIGHAKLQYNRQKSQVYEINRYT